MRQKGLRKDEKEIQSELPLINEKKLNTYVRKFGSRYRDQANHLGLSKTQGFFLGILLEKYFENEEELEIEGRGASFDYLFSNVSENNSMFMKNLNGRRILENSGSDRGSIEQIYASNLKCDWFMYGSDSKGGKVERIFAERIMGKNNFTYTGCNVDKIGDIIIANSHDDSLGLWINNNSRKRGEQVLKDVQ